MAAGHTPRVRQRVVPRHGSPKSPKTPPRAANADASASADAATAAAAATEVDGQPARSAPRMHTHSRRPCTLLLHAITTHGGWLGQGTPTWALSDSDDVSGRDIAKRVVLLALICTMGVAVRLFAVVRYELVMHANNPHFKCVRETHVPACWGGRC